MIITPKNEFGIQYFPIEGDNTYDISQTELERFLRGELKWSKDEDGNNILIENENYLEELERAAKINHVIEMKLEIQDIKDYLQNTDYVVTKIQEALIDENDELVQELRTTYANTISQRKQKRNRMQQLEEDIEQYKIDNDLTEEEGL